MVLTCRIESGLDDNKIFWDREGKPLVSAPGELDIRVMDTGAETISELVIARYIILASHWSTLILPSSDWSLPGPDPGTSPATGAGPLTPWDTTTSGSISARKVKNTFS